MVPLTGRVKDFPGPGKAVPANIESVEVPVPPGLRLTLVGLRDQLLHPGWGELAGEVVHAGALEGWD